MIERNVKAGIPLDTVWVDIDYMERHNNFVLSPDFHGEFRSGICALFSKLTEVKKKIKELVVLCEL